MIKVVFLDVDDTLLSFSEYVKQAMRDGFKKYGLKPYTEIHGHLCGYGKNSFYQIEGDDLCVRFKLEIYIGLCFITGKQFHRPVTTELLLITGWLILKACTINTLAASGEPAGHLIAISMLTLAAWIVSMVLYMLYYKMEPAKAYYAAMVPLIAIGISMTGSLFIISF